MKSIYEKIGVPRNITHEELKKDYKEFCKRYHPDKGGNTEQFTEIKELYAILLDKERRQKYDETGETKVIDKKSAIISKSMKYMQECIVSFSPSNFFDSKRRNVMNSLDGKLRNIEETKERLEDFLSGIVFKKKDNPIKLWLNTEISNAEIFKEKIIKEIDFENEVFDYLNSNISFKEKEESSMFLNPGFSGTSTGTF